MIRKLVDRIERKLPGLGLLKIRYIFLAICLHTHLFSVNFVLFTQPKTGTHLLKPILEELTQKSAYSALGYHDLIEMAWTKYQTQDTFLHLHSAYSKTKELFLTEHDCIVFFVKRDPRDQVVSLLNHYKLFGFLDKSIEKLPNDDERLLRMIEKKLRNQTIAYMGWADAPICCVLSFSNLMGDWGGAATHADAIGEMRKITSRLNLDLSDSALAEIYSKYFGKKGSFFRGKVGSWKDYFKNEHKLAAKRAIGDLLIKLGYEKDYNW